MQIKVISEDTIDNFVKWYIPNCIYNQFMSTVNRGILKRFDDEFGIDSYGAIKFALKHLLVSKHKDNTYTIQFDKSQRYKGQSVMSYVNLITYGNRQIKGYTILLDIFKDISDNIDSLYTAWEMGI